MGVAAAVPAEKIGTVLADVVGRISLFMRGLAVEMFFSCGGGARGGVKVEELIYGKTCDGSFQDARGRRGGG